MLGNPIRAARELPHVFDKYMLPKAAFVMITVASLAGAVLTGLRHGWTGWVPLLVRWGAFWVLALLLGSEMWKIFYLQPAIRVRPVPAAVGYGAAMQRLHRNWQKVLAPLALVLVAGKLILYSGHGGVAWPWVVTGSVALAVALGAIAHGWRGAADALRAELPAWIALAGLAGTVLSLAGLDVALEPGGSPWVLVPNRALHLWAFSAWLGGALWNIFIAVPAGLARVSMDTVILANLQLERFRVVVRWVLPTVVVTGVVQAWVIIGWQWGALFTNLWGYLILAKLGLILTLMVVFVTCPMWRACSPIRGVCNLDDLD